jgi:hypothetical protein
MNSVSTLQNSKHYSTFPKLNIFTSPQSLYALMGVVIALAQLALRLGAIEQYGLHQDELLYLSLADHLDWGYRETPPFIALIGKIALEWNGFSVTAVRIFPALCSALIVYLAAFLTIRLGGKFFAVLLACSSIAFSPAFLASGSLFMPQVFDQLFWLVLAFCCARLVQTKKDKWLFAIAVTAGVGILNKYTIILYLIGLLISVLIFNWELQLLKKRNFYWSIGLVLALISPHLLWQSQHGFNAISHYRELKQTQLDFLTRSDFIIQQLAAHGLGIVIWISGIWASWHVNSLRKYRFLTVSFGFVMICMLILNGKPYYAFGAFPPLFIMGSIFIARQLQLRNFWKKAGVMLGILIPNLVLSIIVLPYLPIDKAAHVFSWMYRNLDMHYPLKWEDQKIHNMNQNYADMIGWQELAKKTSLYYQSMPLHQRKNVAIFTDNYGVAGAMDYYRKSYPLPPIISLKSSYALWAPKEFKFKAVLYINDQHDIPIDLAGIKPKGEVKNPYSRIYGMDIYLVEKVDSNFLQWYASQWKALREKKSLVMAFAGIGFR